MSSQFQPLTYFKRWGFSINEGGTPVNLHAQWGTFCKLFVYVYFFGFRWSGCWK